MRLKICVLALSFCFILKGETLAETNSSELLSQVFGDAITVHTNTTSTTVEYCPDNTCDVFRSLGKQKELLVANFAYLYLYYVSGYAVLSEVRHSEEARRVAEHILIRNGRDKCATASEPETIKCVLRRLAKRDAISLLSARYDEKVRVEFPESLERELSRLKQ
jgi:hypothetical protein